ncbi:MAG: hypothetical protein ACP5UU_03195 [Thermoprotei archaeon]
MGKFRVDVKKGNEIIEIQLAGAYRLKPKVSALLSMGYKVKLVIPVQAILDTPSGTIHRNQASRIFRELAGLAGIFPSQGLEVLILYLREKRTWSKVKRGHKYFVPAGKFKRDTVPVEIISTISLKRGEDLLKLLKLPSEQFTSYQLAKINSFSRTTGSRACYVLRRAGVIKIMGKRRRAYVYAVASPQANSDKSRNPTFRRSSSGTLNLTIIC